MKVKVSRRKGNVWLSFFHKPGGHTTIGPIDMRNSLTLHYSVFRQLPALIRLANRLLLWGQGDEPWQARVDGRWYGSMAEFREYKQAQKGRMQA